MRRGRSGGGEGRIVARKFSLEDFAGLPISEAGELIRYQPVEHAVIYTPAGKCLYYVASRPGSPRQVTVPLWKSGLLRGNVFVHNHPESQSFSPEDVWILLREGAREIRAYGPERSFRMIASGATRRFGYRDTVEGWAELHQAYWNAAAASDMRFKRYVQARLMTDAEAWVAQTHSVLRQLAARYRFTYQEIRS